MKITINQPNISEKNFNEFIELITKLEPIEFLGITKIFCIPIVTKTNDEIIDRPFDEILSDLLDAFVALGCNQRREIIKVLRASLKRK